jgi:hypothetical protein
MGDTFKHSDLSVRVAFREVGDYTSGSMYGREFLFLMYVVYVRLYCDGKKISVEILSVLRVFRTP